ncbi:MAG TPA: hypothetical protein VGH28_24470 [Polyangiaceae bacterium]
MALGHHICADCKKQSPETELNYSLLGLAGWREQRTTDGAAKVEWRCPTCWAAYKKRTRARTQVNLPSLESIPKKRPTE